MKNLNRLLEELETVCTSKLYKYNNGYYNYADLVESNNYLLDVLFTEEELDFFEEVYVLNLQLIENKEECYNLADEIIEKYNELIEESLTDLQERKYSICY